MTLFNRWGLSFIVALLPFAGGRSVYGPSGAWCWIVKDQQAWRTGTWYIPLLVFFIYVITMYIWIVKTLFNEKTQSFYHREAEEEIRNKWKVSSKLSRYPLIFVILWILPIINRGLKYSHTLNNYIFKLKIGGKMMMVYLY